MDKELTPRTFVLVLGMTMDAAETCRESRLLSLGLLELWHLGLARTLAPRGRCRGLARAEDILACLLGLMVRRGS